MLREEVEQGIIKFSQHNSKNLLLEKIMQANSNSKAP